MQCSHNEAFSVYITLNNLSCMYLELKFKILIPTSVQRLSEKRKQNSNPMLFVAARTYETETGTQC